MITAGSQVHKRLIDTPESATHKEILASMSLAFFSDQSALTVSFKDGGYVLIAEHREYPLPMRSAQIERLMLAYMPNISDKTLSLLASVLSHRAWRL